MRLVRPEPVGLSPPRGSRSGPPRRSLVHGRLPISQRRWLRRSNRAFQPGRPRALRPPGRVRPFRLSRASGAPVASQGHRAWPPAPTRPHLPGRALASSLQSHSDVARGFLGRPGPGRVGQPRARISRPLLKASWPVDVSVRPEGFPSLSVVPQPPWLVRQPGSHPLRGVRSHVLWGRRPLKGCLPCSFAGRGAPNSRRCSGAPSASQRARRPLRLRVGPHVGGPPVS